MSIWDVAAVDRLSFLRPLAERDFRLFWLGESISLIGDQFHSVAAGALVLLATGYAAANRTLRAID